MTATMGLRAISKWRGPRQQWPRRAPNVEGCRLLACLFMCAGLAGAPVPTQGAVHALMINGGQRPASNYLSHLHHLEEMFAVLRERGVAPEDIHLFSADGEDEGEDLASRDTRPSAFWLLDGTRLGKSLQPRIQLTNTRWPGVILHPARKTALREWFLHSKDELASGDALFIFVTDHGTGNKEDPDNGAISLWQEKLTVEEFKALLGYLPPGVRVVMAMSQCYSGSFANAMYDDGMSEPFGDVCGFFSTRRDLRAYGCYPEGHDRDEMGHAFRFIKALSRRETTAEAHRNVLVTDSTPDIPLRTSDVYLERVLSKTAATRGVSVETLGDSLLKEAWMHHAAWEPQIRLLDRIGENFGLFSPRSFAELGSYENQLAQLSEQMKTYAGRWRVTLVDLKSAALQRFLKAHASWNERLRLQAISRLNDEERETLLAALLPDLLRYVQGDPDLWQRLQRLHTNARLSSEAEWRLDVRRSALLRMRSVLLQIAGRTLVNEQEKAANDELDAERESLDRLQQCEALAFSVPPPLVDDALPTAEHAYPPLAAERTLLDRVLPSWLGVRFNNVPTVIGTDRDLPRGAAFIQAVYPDSPAAVAGLTRGDIVLGPPGHPFDSRKQLREWIMTSPTEVPLPLQVLRPGRDRDADRSLDLSLRLRPFPLDLPKLPGPPKIGARAPDLPAELEPVGASKLPVLGQEAHVLFFWATWCGPCKLAVPEVAAYSRAKGIPVLAISDEDPITVSQFLANRKQPFFAHVAVDALRESFLDYGVSGTPTIVVVDAKGGISYRQVGYNPAKGLTVDGWSWTQPRTQ